ncbi:SDR family NAD(P)-dependent oxidoreductase [Limosilactobacillus albertensis]|uniref:SDR family NAD(P)-dependent oxidoreductase n=1 Tax=Limosilactobacillus albertensis TaxID=2759752 RepID=A0A839H6U8_9LACO|nr:SDR family NAD(P)-dependent oxidoreductase [Limosilactobacillus albertensis]MBB1122826.1 SDR family NAD(P)-dependent oxidoreductase [Limosilactobacillus albertensis]MCD7122530.1 SDR family NAD(P)-dependent oxidoreductase [Limosilactobacillus albertensis]
MGRLENKVAIVTGGSKGIGEAIAERFVEEGAKVVITARHTEEGEALANKLGENALFIQQDVSKKAEWEKVIKETIDHFGKVNIIVNNAGIGVYADVEQMDDDNWDKTIGINLTGTMWGIKLGIKAMKDNGEKNSIINLSSIITTRQTGGLHIGYKPIRKASVSRRWLSLCSSQNALTTLPPL